MTFPIEFTMKFRQKDTFMASLSDHDFKHRNLVPKILLLAEKAGHATISFSKGQTGEHCDISLALLLCHLKVES